MNFLQASPCCTAGAAVLLALSFPVLAQEPVSAYPSRPVTIVSPFAAGGPSDKEVRLETDKMQELLRQPFLVDFRAGAGGTIAASYVAKARPDGYTLLLNLSSFTTTPALFKDLPFDIAKDFAPVSVVSEKPTALVVGASFPAKNIVEYLAYAKANPGKLNYATTGPGSNQHLVGAWLHSFTNTSVTFVHYKGSAPLGLDLAAGRVDVSSTTLLAILPQVKSGKLRALAVTDRSRSKLLPDVPTMMEQGVNLVYANWTGVLAPGATPVAIVNKLSDAFAKIVRTPDVIAKLEAAGNVPVGNAPAQFKQLIATETVTWQKVVREAGIKMEE